VINDLLKLDVSAHIEKKNNLSFLSWAWAWTEALKADPLATFNVHTYEECGTNGAKRTVPYLDINGTAMVFVTVTMFGKPMTCQLPVMDYRNKAIPNPDAFAVNTAIMRCMTKALSLHGLGLYIYAGEDLPEQEERKKEPLPVINEHQAADIYALVGETKADVDGMLNWVSSNADCLVTKIEEIPVMAFPHVVKMLEAKRKKL
jgi:hypothetical protein